MGQKLVWSLNADEKFVESYVLSLIKEAEVCNKVDDNLLIDEFSKKLENIAWCNLIVWAMATVDEYVQKLKLTTKKNNVDSLLPQQQGS